MGLTDDLRKLFFRGPGDLGLRTDREELRAFYDAVKVHSIAEAPLGVRVQLRAKVVVTHAKLVGPVSDRACVLANVRRGSIGSEMNAGDNDPAALEYQTEVDFALEDASGRAYVRARAVSALLRVGARYRSYWHYDDAASLADAVRGAKGSYPHSAVQSQGITYDRAETRGGTPRWVTENDDRYRVQYDERRLEPGQRVRVFCALSEAVGGDAQDAAGAGYRDLAHRRVVQAADDAMYIYVTEDDERDEAV